MITLLCGGLPWDCEEDDLAKIFRVHGTVHKTQALTPT